MQTPYQNAAPSPPRSIRLSATSRALMAVVVVGLVVSALLLTAGPTSSSDVAGRENVRVKSLDEGMLGTRPARKEEQKEEAEEAKEEAEEEAKEHAEEAKEDAEKAREKAEDAKEKARDKKKKHHHHKRFEPDLEEATQEPSRDFVTLSTCMDANGTKGPCMPGREFCGDPYKNAPAYHLMDQHGCAENDPNGPVFDPVHGVIHHFYQIHLAASPGHGPDYGHFVSKDFVHWAPLPVAIWNGYDSSFTPLKQTPYDNEAIFTGSAVVVDGAGPGGAPGVVNIYPGLCNNKDWENCTTGTLLAQAVPADYANDELLVNWTKPSYNPIVESTQRDPTTPWKTASGEWQLRDYTGTVYGSASDADLLEGKWYKIGKPKDMRQCECPSFYPLPGPSPGSEEVYQRYLQAGKLPTHVHKTSCGGDWWQIGSYDDPLEKMTLGSFSATPGWEDLYQQKKIDQGQFYASKDNMYPTKTKSYRDGRRINWGWAQVPPASTQTLPREITFNPAARTLQQYPIEELEQLRGPAAVVFKALPLIPGVTDDVNLPSGVGKQSEAMVSFPINRNGKAYTVGAGMGSVMCTAAFPAMNFSTSLTMVPVDCNGKKDVVPVLATEKSFEVRIFADITFVEIFFQQGRAAMVLSSTLGDTTGVDVSADTSLTVDVTAYPIKGIWVTPEEVRAQSRIYN